MVIIAKARSISYTHIIMYKALNGMTPEYITDLFKKTSVAHSRQLRSVGNDMLSIPRTKTSYYDRSFTVDGAKQWNELAERCSIRTGAASKICLFLI